jgi:hypothetical protein
MTTVFQKTGYLSLFLDGGDFSKDLMSAATCNGADPANASNILVSYQSIMFSIPITNIKFQMSQLNYNSLDLTPVADYTEYRTRAAFTALYSGYLTNA